MKYWKEDGGKKIDIRMVNEMIYMQNIFEEIILKVIMKEHRIFLMMTKNKYDYKWEKINAIQYTHKIKFMNFTIN